MKVHRSSSRAGLFLIELIIAIVFFAVASAICIQLFVKAHLISARSSDLGAASLIAQNYAEEYKAMSYGEKLERFFPGGDGSLEERYCGYNTLGEFVWLQSGEDGAVYLLQATHDDAFSPTLSARVQIYKLEEGKIRGDSLFSLDVKSYGETGRRNNA